MKKLLAILLVLFSSLEATNWSAEARLGYFWPTSELIRELYPSGGFEGEFQANYDFDCHWQGWGNVSYFRKEGRSSLGDKTTLRIIPLSFGLNYVFLPESCYRPYLGFGGNYTFYRSINDTGPIVSEHTSNSGWGFVAKSGLYVQLACRFYLDVFFDWHYNRLFFHGTENNSASKLQVGGLRTGVGLGYQF